MRIDPAQGVNRAGRVAVGRPATLRDPARAPIDVRVRDLSVTGALLEGEASLPAGSLVSLGIAGAGMQLARVVRQVPQGLAVEFVLPLDPAAIAAAQRAETLVSVAFPQVAVPRPGFAAGEQAAASRPPPPVAAGPAASSPPWLWIALAAAVLLLVLVL